METIFAEHKLVASILIIVVAMLLRFLLVRAILKKSMAEAEINKRWVNTVNNVTQLLVVLGLITIWFSELRFFALSIAAFVVGLVVATREFIQCILGFMYIGSARQFSVGDWIKINGYSGEVVRSDWLSTTLLEVDLENLNYAYTGKTLFIPNNQFVISTVQNMNFMRRYVLHSFTLVREAEGVNVCQGKEFILAKAREYCAQFGDDAERYASAIGKSMGKSNINTEPSVRVTTNSVAKNVFTVTVFCPTDKALEIEQKITEDFLDYWYEAVREYKGIAAKG